MEHLEGYSECLSTQSDLPPVGSRVTVERWRNRGYVWGLRLWLQVKWPEVNFVMDNRSEGGATSRDMLAKVRELPARSAEAEKLYDLVFFSVGMNDVWRGFQQGRRNEAVGAEEFGENYAATLDVLSEQARGIACIGQTPFGPIDEPSVVATMNSELARYDAIAAEIAKERGICFIDVSTTFIALRDQWSRVPSKKDSNRDSLDNDRTLWTDGVHLSELGDAVMLDQIENFLTEREVVSLLLT